METSGGSESEGRREGLEVRHEKRRHRFVVDLESGPGYLNYRELGGGRLDFAHTYVPPPERNRGVGEAIVLAALDRAREAGATVVPSCPFVKRVVDAHPEYAEIVQEKEPPALGPGSV